MSKDSRHGASVLAQQMTQKGSVYRLLSDGAVWARMLEDNRYQFFGRTASTPEANPLQELLDWLDYFAIEKRVET